MKLIRRIATGTAIAGLAVGGAVTIGAGTADAAPRGCSPIYNYWAGASISCPIGTKVTLELDCVGLGRNTGEQQGVRVFYHRTATAPKGGSGFAAADCGQGSYIGSGVNLGSWAR